MNSTFGLGTEGRGLTLFDKMLVSKNTSVDRKRVRSVAVSATVHVSLVALMVCAAVFMVEVVKDPSIVPDLLISFIPAPEMTPPPPVPKVEIAKKLPPPEPEKKIEPPKPELLKIEPPKIVKLRPVEQVPDINLPEEQLKQQKQEIAVTKLDTKRMHEQAPDVMTTSRTPGKAGRPELALAADQLKGKPGVTGSLDAPDVALGGVANGKSPKPSGLPALSSDRMGRSNKVLYGGPSGGDPDVTTVAGGPGGKGGGAPAGRPGAGLNAGGLGGNGNSIKYAAGPADAGPGNGPAGAPSRGSGNSRLDAVRMALANKYGLPLVAVGDIGQRSTDAARWNLLLPELTDLLKQALTRGAWRGGEAGVVSLQRDGRNFVIRYDDGIVHVLTVGDDGLAALFVARQDNARAVTSKVAEAENARSALYAYIRGAS